MEIEQQSSPLAELIIQKLPQISVNLEIGQAIKTVKWTYNNQKLQAESCPEGRFYCPYYFPCRRFRKFEAQLRFRRLRNETACIFRDYLQVCIIQC